MTSNTNIEIPVIAVSSTGEAGSIERPAEGSRLSLRNSAPKMNPNTPTGRFT